MCTCDTRIPLLASFGVLLAVSFASACGSDTPDPTGIGPVGGTVVSSDGASITVPAGALSTNVAIVLDSTDAPAGAPVPGTPRGAIYRVQPHGTVFASPATIRLPLSGSGTDLGVVTLDDEADSTWESVPGVMIEGGEVRFEVSHLSLYVIVPCGGGVDCGFCVGACDSIDAGPFDAGPLDAGPPVDAGPADVCGDGMVTGAENCDTAIVMGTEGWCPDMPYCQGTSSDPCQPGFVITGSGPCDAQCGGVLISSPQNGDGCCPTDATPANDDDC